MRHKQNGYSIFFLKKITQSKHDSVAVECKISFDIGNLLLKVNGVTRSRISSFIFFIDKN